MVEKKRKNSQKVDNKNIYKSNRHYSDRNSKSATFPEFNIKINKISTVLLLLHSEESDVVEQALYHLDKFASLGTNQLYELNENRIYENALIQLIKSDNDIVRKFSFKLLVQLIHAIDECRKKMLTDALIEETKTIFLTSTDDVLVEFSCIILHYICDDLNQIDRMGRDETFMKSVFNKFTSHDDDILLQTIRLLNLIIKNRMLSSSILTMKDFPYKNLEIELRNDCHEIQMAALESLDLITENAFKEEFASDRLIEVIYGMCMQNENLDLQQAALNVFKNFCKEKTLILKLSQQYFPKFLQKFLDKETEKNREETLSILAEFAKIDDNKRMMCEMNGILLALTEMIRDKSSIEACNTIANMSTNIYCLEEILKENIYKPLLNVAMNIKNDWNGRTIALTTFQKLINLQGYRYLMDISDDMSKSFASILENTAPFNVILIIISIMEKIASCGGNLKSNISASDFLANGIFHAFLSTNRNTKLIIRLFHLLANYIDQDSFRRAFIQFDGCELIEYYLKSSVDQMRASVCSLITMSSCYPELSMLMINEGILKMLFDNFECSVCSDGFEKILDSDLSLKFAIRRRLEVNDKISSGFYASNSLRLDYMKLRELMCTDLCSPIIPIYTINLKDVDLKLNCNSRTILKDIPLIEFKSSLMNDVGFMGCELHEKIRILAKKVSEFVQTDDNDCLAHHFAMHLNELKFKFSSSVINLGSLKYGNSFEAAFLFKVLADQLNIDASFVAVDKNGKSWNEVCNGNNIVDLIFDIGEIYESTSYAAQKYLQNIS